MAGYLAAKLRACDASQMVVDDRDELVKGVSLAVADRDEKVRDCGRVRLEIRYDSSVSIGHDWEHLKGNRRTTRLAPPAAQ
jgi:hypothetical protein